MTNVQTGLRADEAAVRALAARAEQVDQVAPLDEATLLALGHDARAVHLTAHDDGRLVGYAQVRADGDGWVGELVVDPDQRRRGTGTALLAAARAETGGPLEVWAHGDLPAAQALLAAVGARPVRELWMLGRDLAGLPAPAAPPPGVTLRPFRVGEDEAAWLAVNARAFAHHPEQGRTTLADLLVREREPWFDAEGFVLAVTDDGTLLGSVWTKVQPGVGEIYVLGVDPAAQGMGLGRVLTGAGLGYLAGRGLGRVVLFVESDNDAALATYRTAGFVREAVHTRYRLPGLG